MRRFLAYIVMMLTMIGTLIFNTQAVLEQRTEAMEFSNGTEIVYELQKREKDDYNLEVYKDLSNDQNCSPLQDIDIEKQVMARLDLAGVRNSNVKIVEGDKNTQKDYMLKISFSPLNTYELAHVKQVLQMTGSLSIGTVGDDKVLYAASDQFFDTSDPQFAKILYNGNSPYPTIKVKDNNEFDQFKTDAENAYEAHKGDKKPESEKDKEESSSSLIFDNKDFIKSRIKKEGEPSSDSSDSEESSDSSDKDKVYLWYNKMKSDTYDKAFGTNDVTKVAEVASKVIATIDLNNYDKETRRLSILNSSDGQPFDASTARCLVNALNAKDYGFNLKFLYEHSINPSFSDSGDGVKTTMIVSIIVLAVTIIFMVLLYGLSGFTASLTMCTSLLLTFFIFSLLGFEFSIAAVIGLVVTGLLSLLISINYFERVKFELKKGRELFKANQEGFRKSFLNSVDMSLVTFIVSVFSFLFSVGSFKTFFGVLMLGTIFAFLITTFLNKWCLYWVTLGISESKKKFIFGLIFNEKHEQVRFVKEESKIQKHLNWIVPSIIALGLAVSLPLTYFLGGNESFFNNQNDFSNSYTLNISYTSNPGDSQGYLGLGENTDYYISYIQGIGSSDKAKRDDEEFVFAKKDEEINNDNNLPIVRYNQYDAYAKVVKHKNDEDQDYCEHYFTVTVLNDLNELKTNSGKDVATCISTFISDKQLSVEIDKNGTKESVGISSIYSHIDDKSIQVHCGLTKPTNVEHNYNSMFLLAYLVSVFASVYMLIRHGIHVALSNLVNGTVTVSLMALLLIVARIPFSSFTSLAILAAIILFNMLSVLVISTNKTTLKEMEISRSATIFQREDVINENTNKSLAIVIPISAITVIIGILLMFINPACMGLGIGLIAFSLINVLSLYFYSPQFYYLISCNVKFDRLREKYNKHKEKRGKKVEEQIVASDGEVYVDQVGPHETIVPGVNEFRKKRT